MSRPNRRRSAGATRHHLRVRDVRRGTRARRQRTCCRPFASTRSHRRGRGRRAPAPPRRTPSRDRFGATRTCRPETRPRVKTAAKFETIKQEIVTANEIEGFLTALLSNRERERFAETKEISVYHATPEAGTFQVSAFYDGGRPACIFTPASKSIPPLAKLGGDAAKCAELVAKRSGLILVTGPMPGGKSTFLASLFEESLRSHEFLVTFGLDRLTQVDHQAVRVLGVAGTAVATVCGVPVVAVLAIDRVERAAILLVRLLAADVGYGPAGLLDGFSLFIQQGEFGQDGAQ